MGGYKVNFGSGIEGIVENEVFAQPFSNRVITEKVIKEYSDKLNSVLIGIDGTEFTSHVETIDGSVLHSSNNTFLEPGTDGVILHGLNSISENRFGYRNKVGIILGVADCSPIIGSTKDGDTMFNIHAGYKGVLGNGEQGNPGILFNFLEEIKKLGIDFDDLEKLHLGPTAGNNFELPNFFYKNLVSEISKEYKGIIDFNNPRFFIKTHKLNKDRKEVGYLNLKEIIKTILIVHGVPKHKIEDFLIDTTNPNNNWPSYRLYSKGSQEKNNRLSATIFKNLKE